MAQSKEDSIGYLLGLIGLGNSFNLANELGPTDITSLDSIDSSSAIRAVNLGDDYEAVESEANKCVVDIMVDLNDASCRR